VSIKRLVDGGHAGDPEDRFLAELVQSTQVPEPNPFSKRIIHRRVIRGDRSRWYWLMRLGPVAGIMLGGTAMAAAAVEGYVWFERTREPSRAVATASTSPETDEHRAHGRSITWKALGPGESAPAPAPIAAEAVAVAEPNAGAVETVPSREPGEARRGAALARVSRSTPAAQAATLPSTDPSEDPSEVVEAVRALRKEGDAARAQRLLDHYLTAHPRGAFAEDALALAIEAASARHDPSASGYAKQYLARFPSGRFRAVARRALESAR